MNRAHAAELSGIVDLSINNPLTEIAGQGVMREFYSKSYTDQIT